MNRFKWFLVIVWMFVIFYFSNQVAVVSNEKSQFLIHVFTALGLNLNNLLGDLANFIVRKLGHFSEYLVLYLLLFNALSENHKVKKSLIMGLGIVFLYACSDEFHQMFIPGRAARVADVLIDTSGGALAYIIVYLKRKGFKN